MADLQTPTGRDWAEGLPDEVAARVVAQRGQRLGARRREAVRLHLVRLAAVVAGLAAWWALARRFPPLVLPSPLEAGQALVDNWQRILREGRVTLIEVFAGFAVGSALGFGLGCTIAYSRRAEAILNPFVIASQAVPKVALAPLFVIWFGFGITSKIAVAAAIAFFPLLENTVVGLRRVDDMYLKLFVANGASSIRIFYKLRLINALPLILAAARVSLIFALVGAIVGEFIAGNRGLGAMIVQAQGSFNTPVVFAAIVSLTVLGMVLYGLLRLIERRVLESLHLGAGSVGTGT